MSDSRGGARPATVWRTSAMKPLGITTHKSESPPQGSEFPSSRRVSGSDRGCRQGAARLPAITFLPFTGLWKTAPVVPSWPTPRGVSCIHGKAKKRYDFTNGLHIVKNYVAATGASVRAAYLTAGTSRRRPQGTLRDAATLPLGPGRTGLRNHPP